MKSRKTKETVKKREEHPYREQNSHSKSLAQADGPSSPLAQQSQTGCFWNDYFVLGMDELPPFCYYISNGFLYPVYSDCPLRTFGRWHTPPEIRSRTRWSIRRRQFFVRPPRQARSRKGAVYSYYCFCHSFRSDVICLGIALKPALF